MICQLPDGLDIHVFFDRNCPDEDGLDIHITLGQIKRFYLGSTTVSDIYFGPTKVKEVWFGSVLIWNV